jgi:hypothetical protein
LLLAFVKPGIFQAQDIARLHCVGGRFCRRTDAVRHKCNGAPHNFRQCRSDRAERLLWVRSLGTAQMRKKDDLATLAGDLRNRWCDPMDPRRIADFAILNGNIEIDAQQHAFAANIDLIEGAEARHSSTVLTIGFTRASEARPIKAFR